MEHPRSQRPVAPPPTRAGRRLSPRNVRAFSVRHRSDPGPIRRCPVLDDDPRTTTANRLGAINESTWHPRFAAQLKTIADDRASERRLAAGRFQNRPNRGARLGTMLRMDFSMRGSSQSCAKVNAVPTGRTVA
jgi:hypothetical protein